MTAVDLLLPVLERLDRIEKQNERALRVINVLLDRFTDASHLSFAEIARIQNISKTTARRRYGQWLEVIPDSKRQGVPRERLVDGWVPAAPLATARRREKRVA